MPKLALVVPNLINGGGVTSVAKFIKNACLRSGRYELKIISLSMSADDNNSSHVLNPKSWIQGETTYNGVWDGQDFTHVGARLGEFEFQRYRKRNQLSKLLIDCDVIQVVCGSAAWANPVLGIGRPVALQVATRVKIERRMRDSNPMSLIAIWRKIMTSITDKLDNRALKRVDAIQVENPWMLEYVKSINKNIKRTVDICYAPPGVDSTFFTPLKCRNLESDSYILCVGRLSDPRKKISILFDAYRQLPQRLKAKTRLVLAGYNPPPEEFWIKVDEAGLRDRVQFFSKPSSTDLVSLYQHAALFVLPSDEEGLGLVVLEAMSCGIPVIATRCGGPEGIITDGIDGVLVPLDDPEVMSIEMAKLLIEADLNIRIGLEARVTIENRYDELKAGAVFVNMWDKLLKY